MPGALCGAGDSGFADFICSHGLSSTTNLWSSAGLGRLYMLPLGERSLAFCVLETVSPSTDTGTCRAHPHQLTPAKLQNCYSHVKSGRLSSSEDLTLTQVSLSISIISSAGAARLTGLAVWEVGCWAILSLYVLHFVNGFVALKLHEICF